MADEDVFVRILEWLAGQQAILFERAADGPIDEPVYAAAARHPVIHARLISKMGGDGHSGAIDMRFPRHAILLAPVTNGDRALPALSPHWDFVNGNSVNLYLGLYFHDDSWEHVDGMGFRYESPHGSGKDSIGRHDFFHAQPINDFSRGTGSDLPVEGRVHPTATPAFPLEAQTHAQLLVCLLISLYGGGYAARLAQSGIEGIAGVLDTLKCCDRAADGEQPDPGGA